MSTTVTPPPASTSTPPVPESVPRTRRGDAAAMDAAKTPVGVGAIALVGIVLALLLTALGVVAVREALLAAGVLTGTAWQAPAGPSVRGLAAASWMVPVGAVLVLFGLWLLVAALRPRPRTATTVTSATGVFLRPKDVSRLAQTAAEQVDGVLAADVSATRRAVRVRVRGTGAADVNEHVRAAVARRLSALDRPPTVNVSVEGGPK